jgi:hypothetical protein
MKWVTGSPDFQASMPAQIFPKFPLGTEKTGAGGGAIVLSRGNNKSA